jgi:hypothetical protein
MGFAAENLSFPSVLPCPFCGEIALYAYDDVAREDVWLNCDGCSVHGNIITFAAQIWKVSIAAAVDRFADEKLCLRNLGADDYIAETCKHVAQLQKFEALWAEAADQLWVVGSDITTHKLRDFGVSKEIDCRGLVGVVEEGQVAAAYSATGRAYPRHMRNGEPLLVFPYYDLPGRISGLLLTKYGPEFDFKRVFLPVTHRKAVRSDAGYYLLKTALLPPHPTIKNDQIIVDDPVWALKAQTTQLRHGLPLLPICAGYTGFEAASLGTSWLSFPHNRKFFYGRNVTAEIISQAAGCRGYVCTAPPENSFQPPTPARTVKRLATIRKYATTWQAALEEVFNNMNPIAAKSFAARLTIQRDKLGHFLRTRTAISQDDVSDVLNRVIPRRGTSAAYAVENDVIVRDDGWFTPRGAQITNCVPVIEKIIYTDTGEKYYTGYVKKNAKKFPFFEIASRLERLTLLEFVAQFMAGHGELIINNAQFRRKGLPTALKLNPPQILHVCTKPGWNEQTQKFQLGNYAITADGSIELTSYPELPQKMRFAYPEPSVSAPPSIHALLTASYENAFVWANVAAVLSSMIAPILQKDHVSTAIAANSFNVSVIIGKEMGCEIGEAKPGYQTSRTGIGALRQITEPRFVAATLDRGKMLETAVARFPYKPVFVKMTPASLPGALSYGWTALSPITPVIAVADCSALRFIVPAYIQRALRQRMSMQAGSAPLILKTLRDLHKWLGDTYVSSFNIAAAEQIVLTPDKAHIGLMREINNAIGDEKIDILPRPRLVGQKANYIVRGKQHWWIGKKAVDKYLSLAGIVPNWNALINCFTQQGVFRGEDLIHNNAGLLLDRSWCDTFWSDYNTTSSKNVG